MITTIALGGSAYDGQAGNVPPLMNQTAATARQAAWLLEMEREQAQEWLQHRLPAPAAASLPTQFSAHVADTQMHQAASDNASTEHAAYAGQDSASHDAAARMQALWHGNDAQRQAGEAAMDGGSAAPEMDGISAAPCGLSRSMENGAGDSKPLIEESQDQLNTGTRLLTIADGLQKLLSEWMPPSLEIVWNSRSDTPLGQSRQALADTDGAATAESSSGAQETPASVQEATVEGGAWRFHAEASGTDARVWIGVDQSSALNESNLAKLGSEIERLLRQQGMTLQSLVCNGVPVLRTERYAQMGSASVQDFMLLAAQQSPAQGIVRVQSNAGSR